MPVMFHAMTSVLFVLGACAGADDEWDVGRGVGPAHPVLC